MEAWGRSIRSTRREKALRPKKAAGAYYESIETAVPGVRLCEHLKQLAPLMDRVTAVRTVHHEVIDEHAAATNRMHTGRPISGTVTYPSLGSMVVHQRGPAADGAPPYVLIGYPNITRGPGFLGARHGYLYLTDTSQGPAGLSRPDGITPERQQRRESFLAALRKNAPANADSRLLDYEAAIQQSLKLSGPEFNRVFQLDQEPAGLRARYGGEFGQRCLLSRRLVERGVRFIEVSHNLNFLNGAGWDVHNEGIQQQHKLIQELDTAVATLIIGSGAESNCSTRRWSSSPRSSVVRLNSIVAAAAGIRVRPSPVSLPVAAWLIVERGVKPTILSKRIVSNPVSRARPVRHRFCHSWCRLPQEPLRRRSAGPHHRRGPADCPVVWLNDRTYCPA